MTESEATKIDLSRYKTQALAERVADILSVPEAIRTVIKTTLIAVVLLVFANSLLYAVGNHNLIPWLLSSVLALIVAILLGFALGLLRVAGRLATSTESLLELTLETSKALAKDYQAIQCGAKEMPTAAEIVEHAYEGVVLPAIEAAVAKSFGVASRPLLFIYRRTIGNGVKLLVKRMASTSLSTASATQISEDAASVVREVGANQFQIANAIEGALGYTHSATRLLRRTFLLPAQVAFFIVTIVAVTPLFFAGNGRVRHSVPNWNRRSQDRLSFQTASRFVLPMGPLS